jgi:large subunit ribosomal protein L12
MEYIYAAMLLHKAGQKVNESSLKKVLESAGVKVDDARCKALVASLEGVNIDEVIEKAALAAPVMVSGPSSGHEEKQEKKKEEKKDDKKTDEQASAGLSALFG